MNAVGNGGEVPPRASGVGGAAGAGHSRDWALRQLPTAYATALRMRGAGIEDAVIAERLDIEPEAVGPMFEIAQAKLAALLGEAPDNIGQLRSRDAPPPRARTCDLSELTHPKVSPNFRRDCA